MTRSPEYVSARLPVPLSWSYAVLRRFHAAAAVTMVSTRSLLEELGHRGFAHLAMWTRGVDTDLFRPERAAALDLPRPIFVSVGRLAVEKNLAAFLALDLPGSKVVFGDGPQAGELQRRFPNTHFLGQMEGETSAAHIAAGRHAHRTPVAPGTASGLDDGIEGVPRSHTFADHWPIGRRRPMRYLSSEDPHVP